jgi:hypothetical protein
MKRIDNDMLDYYKISIESDDIDTNDMLKLLKALREAYKKIDQLEKQLWDVNDRIL